MLSLAPTRPTKGGEAAERGHVGARAHELAGGQRSAAACRYSTDMQVARMLLLLGVVALALTGAAHALRPAGPAAPAANTLGAQYALDAAAAQRTGARLLTPAAREATFRFDEGVAPYDRAAVLGAVARARPEAQRLIALVDGLTTVRVGSPPSGAVGTATLGPRDPVVLLDLAVAMRIGGQPALDRLVLHELGHVVDFMIVPEPIRSALDADISPGYVCPEPGLNACAEPAERFAETFAKWATGDIGVNLRMGYAAPPPRRSLEAWGRPLARLAAGA
jgi:hypothetical protein